MSGWGVISTQTLLLLCTYFANTLLLFIYIVIVFFPNFCIEKWFIFNLILKRIFVMTFFGKRYWFAFGQQQPIAGKSWTEWARNPKKTFCMRPLWRLMVKNSWIVLNVLSNSKCSKQRTPPHWPNIETITVAEIDLERLQGQLEDIVATSWSNVFNVVIYIVATFISDVPTTS